MIIKKDFSYVTEKEMRLINKGYGNLTVHSIHFDRYFTEGQEKENHKNCELMSNEEWSQYCNEFSKKLEIHMKEILDRFASKYNIHQLNEKTSTIDHYRSDWDLYFYTNKGWNGVKYMDYFKLNFNHNRTAAENSKLLEDVIKLVESIEKDNVYCRIQFKASINEERVTKECISICENVLGKFINYRGMIGKIKVVNEYEGIKEYGFFKKGSKKKYCAISNEEILLNYIDENLLV